MEKLLKSITTIVLSICMIAITMLPMSVAADDSDDNSVADVVFVVDDTKSMKVNDKKKLTGVAVKKYIDKLPKTKQDVGGVGVVTFANKVLKKKDIVYVDSKSKGNEVKKFADNSITQNGSCTNCAKGIKQAVSMLDDSDCSRKAIILVTDGEYDFDGTESSKKKQLAAAKELLDEQIEEAKEEKIQIFTIKINGKGTTSHVGKVDFKKITEKTGGIKYDVDTADEVNDDIKEIQKELWGFIEPDPDPKPIPIPKGLYSTPFNFPKGVVYANIQIDYEEPIKVHKFVYENNKSDVYYEDSDEGDYLNIRVPAPDAGRVILTIKSPEAQKIKINCILSTDVTAEATINGKNAATIDTKSTASIEAFVFNKGVEINDSKGNMNLSAVIKDKDGNDVGDPIDLSYFEKNKYTCIISGKDFEPQEYTIQVEVYNINGEAVTQASPLTLKVDKAPFNFVPLIIGIIAALLIIGLILLILLNAKSKKKARVFGPIRYDYTSDNDDRKFQLDILDGKENKQGVVPIGTLVRAFDAPALNDIVFSATGTKAVPVLQIENKNMDNTVSVMIGHDFSDMITLPPGAVRPVNIGDQINIEIAENNVKLVINREL